MATTQRTGEEASKYILDSIEYWKNNGQDKKIISLSNWAEKWRSNTGGGHVARMLELKKNIRALEGIIKRKKKINPQTDTAALERELLIHQTSYKQDVDKYGEPKPKVKKTLLETAKVE